jgi:hypothetical protein
MFFQGSTVAELAQAVQEIRGEAEADAASTAGGAEGTEDEALELLRMLEGLSDEQVALELANRRGVQD